MPNRPLTRLAKPGDFRWVDATEPDPKPSSISIDAMKSRTLFLVLATLGLSAPATRAEPAGSVPKGKMLYANLCANCHRTSGENTPDGPSLLGVIGRKAGTVEGFTYTEAMKKADLTWTDETVDKYLEAPDKVVAGSRMTLAVAKPTDRTNLIAYLKTLGAK